MNIICHAVLVLLMGHSHAPSGVAEGQGQCWRYKGGHYFLLYVTQGIGCYMLILVSVSLLETLQLLNGVRCMRAWKRILHWPTSPGKPVTGCGRTLQISPYLIGDSAFS